MTHREGLRINHWRIMHYITSKEIIGFWRRPVFSLKPLFHDNLKVAIFYSLRIESTGQFIRHKWNCARWSQNFIFKFAGGSKTDGIKNILM